MKRALTVSLVATLLILLIAGIAFAVSPGEHFEWLSTGAYGIRIGADGAGTPAGTLDFTRYNSYIHFEDNGTVTADNLLYLNAVQPGMNSTVNDGQPLSPGELGSSIQANSAGKAALRSGSIDENPANYVAVVADNGVKDAQGIYTTLPGVYILGDLDSGMGVDGQDVWMLSTGQGLVKAYADGTVGMISSGNASIMCTMEGNIVLTLGGGGEGSMMSAPSGGESASSAVTSADTQTTEGITEAADLIQRLNQVRNALVEDQM